MTGNPTLTEKRRNDWNLVVIFVLLGLQLIMLPWFIIHGIYWSDLDLDFEDNPVAIFLILPLVGGPVLSALAIKYGDSPVVDRFLKRSALYVGLIAQIVVDWLFYAQVHRLIPFSTPSFPPGENVSSGWFSFETLPFTLLIIWLNFSFLVIIPCLLANFKGVNPMTFQFKQEWHLGILILALLLAFRWGGPWGAPLTHLIYCAACLPFLYISLARMQVKRENKDVHSHLPVVRALGFLFYLSWWLMILEFQSGDLLSHALMWIVPAATSAGLFFLNRTREELWGMTPRGRMALVVTWSLMVLATVLSILASLNSWLVLSRGWWLGMGLACWCLFPEMHARLRREGTRALLPRLFLGGIFFLLFGLLPYFANIYDPISSYAGLGLAVIFGLGPCLALAKAPETNPLKDTHL